MGTFFRPPGAPGGTSTPAERAADRNFGLKSQIHKKLLGVLNLDRGASIPKERIRVEIGRVVEGLLEEERVPMTTAGQNRMVDNVRFKDDAHLLHIIEKIVSQVGRL